MAIVLDASMAIAWMFVDERTDSSQQALRRVLVEGAVVPSLWRLEVANVLRNAVRRGRCSNGYASRNLNRLALLTILVDPQTDQHAWGDTRQLALGQDLTLYDAAYLELARRLAQPLATRDDALIRAAGDVGVEVIGP